MMRRSAWCGLLVWCGLWSACAEKPDEVVSAPPLWSSQAPLRCPAGARIVYGRALRWCERGEARHGPLEQINAQGIITARLHFKEGRPDGKWMAFYEDGAPRWRAMYVDGALSGEVASWYADGAKRCALAYEARKPVGEAQCWWPDGRQVVKQPALAAPRADAPPRGQTAWTPQRMKEGVRALSGRLNAAYELAVRMGYPTEPVRATVLFSLHPRGFVVGCQVTATDAPDAMLGDLLCREFEGFEGALSEDATQLFWIEEQYVFSTAATEAQPVRGQRRYAVPETAQ